MIALVAIFGPLAINSVEAATVAPPTQANTDGFGNHPDRSCNILTRPDACVRLGLSLIAYYSLWLTSWVVWVAGVLLNYVLDYTIVKMRDNLADVTGINAAWRAIRDVANMSFIFILLYTAVSTVLGIGRDWRGTVLKVVVAALLINFSMFFTKVIIDATNVIALGFYDAIGVSEQFDRTNDPWDRGISNAVVRPLGVTGFWSPESLDTMRGNTYSNIIIIGIAGSVFLIITAFVLFAASFMFLIRYVVLIFLLILSPLAFVGGVIPGVSGYANKWRDALFGQALFAPVYMMLLWLTLVVFNDTQFSSSNYNQTAAGNNTMADIVTQGSAIGTVMNFLIVIFFLVGTLIISKSFASRGGSGIASFVNKATSGAGAAVFGSAAYVGRGTVGRFANRVSESETLKNMAANGKYGSKYVARTLRATNKNIASRSFDIRSGELGKTLEAGKGTFLGLGKVNKGGYAQSVKDYAKKKEAEAKELKVGSHDKGRQEVVARKYKEGVEAQIAAHKQRHDLQLRTIKTSDDYRDKTAKVSEEKAKQDALVKEKQEKEKQLRDLEATKGTYAAPGMTEVYERRKATIANELDELKRRETDQNNAVAAAEKAVADVDNTVTEHLKSAKTLEQSLLKVKKTKGKPDEWVPKETADFVKDIDAGRIEAFAKETETRSVANPARWFGGTKSGGVKKLRAAESIRGLNKDKKAEEKLKEIAKDLGMTEEGEAGGDGEAKPEGGVTAEGSGEKKAE